MEEQQWDVYLTSEVDQWLNDLEKANPLSYVLVNQAFWILACNGPAEGRPLVDRIKGSALHNLKELRPGSAGRSEVRILFMFDPGALRSSSWPVTRRGTGALGTTRLFLSRRACMRSMSPPVRRRWGSERTYQLVGERTS